MLRVDRHPNGPRLYLYGWRCHHYHAGIATIAVGAAMIVAGVQLVWDDRQDLPVRRLPRFDPVVGVTTSNARGGVW